MSHQIEKRRADVVIVGGGLAGAVAALQAREKGAEVIVLEKGNTYRSGNAGSGLDHIFSYVPPVHERIGYTKDHMKRDLKDTGQYPLGVAESDPGEYFVDVSYERILSLEKYGLNFRFDDSHLAEGFRLVPQFHSVPTSFHFDGRDIKVRLTEAMIEAGVQIINHALVVEILTDSKGRASGAIAVSTRADKVIVVEAKATILATTSGAGRLGEKTNDNQPYFEGPSAANAGFGISLALNAGAELANLEFLITNGGLGFQGFTFTAGAPGGTWWPAARVVDDEGNVVVDRVIDYPLDEPDYLQKNVDQLNKFAAQKVSVGRRLFEGKQLYVDLQEATDEEIGYIRWSMTNEGQMWLYLQNIDAAGVDLKKVKQPFTIKDKVGIGACIERNAGVYVDRHTRTTVERLYAAGDITGGAGFISSAPYAVVFGYEAGLQAAKQAAETDGPEPADESRTDRVIAKIDAITGSGGEHWRNVEQALQGVVTVFGRYPLSDGRIDGALTLIEKLRGDAELKAENPHELSRAFEVLSLFDAAEAIFRAAKHRKTNLGHFKRHPDENRKVYGERIVLDNDGNPVTDETRDVPATEFYALYKDSAGVYRFTVHRTGK